MFSWHLWISLVRWGRGSPKRHEAEKPLREYQRPSFWLTEMGSLSWQSAIYDLDLGKQSTDIFVLFFFFFPFLSSILVWNGGCNRMCSTPHWISEVVNFNSLSPASSRTLAGDISQFFTVLVSLAIGLHDKLWEVNILSWKFII